MTTLRMWYSVYLLSTLGYVSLELNDQKLNTLYICDADTPVKI